MDVTESISMSVSISVPDDDDATDDNDNGCNFDPGREKYARIESLGLTEEDTDDEDDEDEDEDDVLRDEVDLP